MKPIKESNFIERADIGDEMDEKVDEDFHRKELEEMWDLIYKHYEAEKWK